jgi:hypothetical protein
MHKNSNQKTIIMGGYAYEKQGYGSCADFFSVCHPYLSGHTAFNQSLVGVCHNNRAVPVCCFDLPHSENQAQVVSSHLKVKRIMKGELRYEM